MSTDALETSLGWMHSGTACVLAQLDNLSDAEVLGPSALPGWTRAHVLSHIARNADALGNLLAWARTGVETPMYASAEARAEGIAAGAGRDPDTIRADVRDAVARLDGAVSAMPDDAWRVEVRTGMGRRVEAAHVPFMRAREVWVHAVDLDAGVGFADVPRDVLDALLTDAAASFSARDGCPAARLVATDSRSDRPEVWVVGDGGVAATAAVVAEVRGPAGALTAWLLGRDAGAGLTVEPEGALPDLAPWL